MLQHGATWCNVVQRDATCCNVVQHGATWCNMVQHGERNFSYHLTASMIALNHIYWLDNKLMIVNIRNIRLEELRIQKNQMTEVPDAISRLSRWTTNSPNSLSSFYLFSFQSCSPAFILFDWCVFSLKTLDLGDNLIVEVNDTNFSALTKLYGLRWGDLKDIRQEKSFPNL